MGAKATPQIEIKQMTKEYKNGVKALDEINLSIGSGVFGLLGHNGAGKTTLMRAIATLLQPSSGTIKVMGHDVRKEGEEVRRNIGYLPQELDMYASLTVIDFVGYMAALKGVKSREAVKIAIEQVDMSEYGQRKIGQLSGGMKRRVGIAQALVGNPRILIVDEPTAGLDPGERVRFRGVLSRFAKDGNTVLLSTHIVEDVYQLCERLAVLRKGELFFSGSAQSLLTQVSGKVKIIEVANESALIELQRKAVVLSTTYEHNRIQARIMDEHNAFAASAVNETLEDAYVYCMGGKAHE